MERLLKRAGIDLTGLRRVSLWNIVLWAWFVLLAFTLLRGARQVFADPGQPNHITAAVCLLIVLGAAYGLILWRIQSRLSDPAILLVIVLVALAVRLALVPFSIFQPVSDFANYLQAGCDFRANGFGSILHMAQQYGIWQFVGLSVLMGIQALLCGPTLLGFQLTNCLLTAVICGEIFWLGRRISRPVALIGALFYTIYPVSVISSQVTTNQHGAAVMTLASVSCFVRLFEDQDRGGRGWLRYGIACLVFAMLADFYHPSAILLVASYVVFAFFYALHHRRSAARLVGLCKRVGLVVLGYLVLSQCAQAIVVRYAGTDTLTSRSTLAGKLYVGANVETNGGYAVEDYVTIWKYPKEEQLQVALRGAAERLGTPHKAAAHYTRKIARYMFDPDNLFNFYTAQYTTDAQNALSEVESLHQSGAISDEEYQSRGAAATARIEKANVWVLRTAAGADRRFVWVLWVLCAVGVLRTLKSGGSPLLAVLIIFTIGWMSWTMLSELQPRYRYLSIPAVCLLAAYGLEGIWSAGRRLMCAARGGDAPQPAHK